MELSELPKLEDADTTPAKDTYRTLKPPDRCVISYNFEQTHSLNVTHNLLIGMFNDPTKNTHKQQSFKSADNNKNKLFSIVPTHKKIARQQQKTSIKTHESRLHARRYIPAGSPRREDAQTENHAVAFEKTQPQSKQSQIENNVRWQVQDEGGAQQQLDGGVLFQARAFDENRQEQASSLQKRSVIKKENQGHRAKLQNGMEGRERKTEIEYNEEQQNRDHKQGHNQNNITSNQVAANLVAHRDQPRAQLTAQQNHQNQIALNQPSLRQNHAQIIKQLQPLPEEASQEGLSHKSEQRIPSRKQIQDQQLRQLEERVRQQEGLNLKKYNFKKTEGNQQLLPFNDVIDPYRHQASKYIRRTSSSKKIQNMTQANSYHRSNQNNDPHQAKNKGTNEGAKKGERSYRMGGKQNCSMQKQSNNKKGMPSIHQVRQSKAKQFSINQLQRYNHTTSSLYPSSNNANSIHPSNLQSQTVSGLRKVHEISATAGNSQGKQLKPDLTENNMIKGFKVARNPQLKTSSSAKGNSVSMSNQPTEKKMADIGSQHKPKISRQPRNNNKQIRDQPENSRPNRGNKPSIQQINDNKQANSISSRSPRHNTAFQPTEGSQHPQNNALNNHHTDKSPTNSSVTPRTAKDKNFYNKRWKESQLEKKMKDSRDSRGRRDSQLSRDKKLSSNSNKASGMKPRRKEKSAEIDLDAEEEDKFGLLAQKNVTTTKNSRAKANKEGKKIKKKDDKRIGEIREEPEKSINKISDKDQQMQQSSNAQSEEQSIVRQNQLLYSSHYPPQRQHSINQHQTNSANDHQTNSANDHQTHQNSSQPTPILAPSNKPPPQSKENKQSLPHGEQLLRVGSQSEAQKVRCEAEAVQQIEQLIEQNGELSRIDSLQESAKQNANRRFVAQGHSPVVNQRQVDYNPSLAPIANNKNNLEELLIATEELPPQFKISEPALQKVEREFGWSKEQIEPNQQRIAANHQLSIVNQQQQQDHINKRLITHTSTVQKQQIIKQEQSRIKQEQNRESNDKDMQVNLPLPNLCCKKQGTPITTKEIDNETDYHEQERDQIDQFATRQRRNEADALAEKEEISKTEDFFAHNLKELSKVSDLANVTNYQPIDKNIIHYSRAPILSFLYDMPHRFHSHSQSFIPSKLTHQLLQNIRDTAQIGVQPIDQAVNILLSIDPWIVERVFEPFEDREERIGIWLYCRGQWTLFLQRRQCNYRNILLSAITKAIEILSITFELETVLKLISGVRIIWLKSSKKRVFKQLEFSLKKGHTLKALASKQSKWGERLFTVNSVQVTKDQQNVLQIREQNETYWVKQAKLKEIFEHFLLICTRKAHFWTHRNIQYKPSHKSVITLSSEIPAHGSITLFYPSAAPSNLLLYKELQSKVLKFMGKIQEKSNQNGNLYFQFRLHGNYCIFLQAPEDCVLAVQSTSQLQIGEPEYVLSQTLKNEQCEYLQLSSQLKHKSHCKQLNRSGETLLKLREKFISLVVQK